MRDELKLEQFLDGKPDFRQSRSLGAAEAEGQLQFCCRGVVLVAGEAQAGAPTQQRGCDSPDEQEDVSQPVIFQSEPRSGCNLWKMHLLVSII